jgi:hypothetical protein
MAPLLTGGIGAVFECRCPPGFVGDLCERSDPCLSAVCNHGTCAAVDSSYVCNCDAGFRQKQGDAKTCEDVSRQPWCRAVLWQRLMCLFGGAD